MRQRIRRCASKPPSARSGRYYRIKMQDYRILRVPGPRPDDIDTASATTDRSERASATSDSSLSYESRCARRLLAAVFAAAPDSSAPGKLAVRQADIGTEGAEMYGRTFSSKGALRGVFEAHTRQTGTACESLQLDFLVRVTSAFTLTEDDQLKRVGFREHSGNVTLEPSDTLWESAVSEFDVGSNYVYFEFTTGHGLGQRRELNLMWNWCFRPLLRYVVCVVVDVDALAFGCVCLNSRNWKGGTAGEADPARERHSIRPPSSRAPCACQCKPCQWSVAEAFSSERRVRIRRHRLPGLLFAVRLGLRIVSRRR